MKRKWIGAAVAVGVFIAAGVFWNAGNTTRMSHRTPDFTGSTDVANAQPVPVRAPVVTVITASLMASPLSVEATGTVMPELESSVASKVTARVVYLAVREGDKVRRGQILVDLNASDLDASVSGAAAGLRAATASASQAQTTAVMESMLDQARLRNAQAGVTRAEAAARAAGAQFDVVKAGPRAQEREQAIQAAVEAQANMTLAQSNLQKITSLYQQGAVSRQLYESAQTDAQVAQARLAIAKQAESLAQQGSRPEDIRAAAEALQEAQAALVQAHAGLAQARAEALQVKVGREATRAAQAQVGQSRAALDTARITREFATITAPFDGIVSARLVDPGAMASPGVPLLKIQGGQLRLEAVVSEDDLGSAHLGNTVPVELDAFPGKLMVGRVVEIAPQGDPASHTFVVKVALPEHSGARVGMFGRVRFRTGAIHQLLAPLSAVWEQQGLEYLFVVDNADTAHLRLITIGEPIGDRVPILSGLNPGERIVVSGRERITDGARVVPR